VIDAPRACSSRCSRTPSRGGAVNPGLDRPRAWAGHGEDGHGGRPRHRPAGLVRFEGLRQLLNGEIAGELRAIARDDERASRDEWRVLNRLRADRLETFPAALAIAGDDLGAHVPTAGGTLADREHPGHSIQRRAGGPRRGDQARQAGNASPPGSPRRWHRTLLVAASFPL
jgi:hypothetical protein